MDWEDGTSDRCLDLSGSRADGLAVLSAHWDTPRHHVVQAIALAALLRQAVDGAARIRARGSDRGRVVFAPGLALSEAVRTVGRLVDGADAIVVTTANGGSGLTERVGLKVVEGR